jgi:glycosyltransferase involved in cell wall biosynthesis
MISVVIPAYNAEAHISRSIGSAHKLPQVSEIIVVNDGSSDSTEDVLQSLCKAFSKLKVVYHPNKENKGIGNSRNLGVINSTSSLIAFLDSDDEYLPNRFKLDVSLLKDSRIGGVYNPVQNLFKDGSKEMVGFTESLANRNPLDCLMGFERGMQSFTHVNGLTIRKNCFLEIGGFNGNRIGEDVHFLLRLFFSVNMCQGNTEPVAIRYFHESNITNHIPKSVFMEKHHSYRELADWFKKKNAPKKYINEMLRRSRINKHLYEGTWSWDQFVHNINSIKSSILSRF